MLGVFFACIRKGIWMGEKRYKIGNRIRVNSIGQINKLKDRKVNKFY